jgi:membrane-associated phospholipid phosphatase
MLLAAAAIAGGLSTLVRYCGGRFRPEHINGENIWQLWRGGTDLSWPSGHATLAFATAAALTYLSPRGRWLFVFVAAACAVARVVMQAHFWSDVIMGSVLGWSVGWFVTVWIDRMMKTDAAVSPPGPAKA